MVNQIFNSIEKLKELEKRLNVEYKSFLKHLEREEIK
jgi:hypothetical protein